MTRNRLATALLAAAALLSILGLPTDSLAASHGDQTEADARAMYAGLRSQALSTTAAEIGVATTLPAYGALIEFLIDGETVTLVAFATGDGSLYFSPGGGMIGGIEIPAVADAAKAFVTAAGGIAPTLPKTETFPHPQGEEIRFYVLTSEGVRTGSAEPEALETGRHPLSPLFLAANHMISGFTTAEQPR
ncbi:MAG: hypothetical protein EON85_07840 [Brevundimonas sp.]|nr:MAG: hypothetical protein EON85_07840 [Brevundimonas sp.]